LVLTFEGVEVEVTFDSWESFAPMNWSGVFLFLFWGLSIAFFATFFTTFLATFLVVVSTFSFWCGFTVFHWVKFLLTKHDSAKATREGIRGTESGENSGAVWHLLLSASVHIKSV